MDEDEAVLLVSSRNYSSWSLRGWLLARMSGLPFLVRQVDPADPDARAELLMRSSSVRVPCLVHGEVRLWDVLAIAEHLNETRPEARMMPEEPAARAKCRSISGEMHSGFEALRTALPMNLRLHRPNFPTWSAVRADVARIEEIWRGCLGDGGGPWLFGERRSVADAMYAPVCTRFLSYDVKLDPACDAYCRATMEQPDMVEWVQAALEETEAFSELEMEF
jgi:glutathione S-transferase